MPLDVISIHQLSVDYIYCSCNSIGVNFTTQGSFEFRKVTVQQIIKYRQHNGIRAPASVFEASLESGNLLCHCEGISLYDSMNTYTHMYKVVG